jgi:DNA-binding CsgD family transcriptional regulator
MSVRSPNNEHIERILSACQAGLVLVDAAGNVVWMDEATRRRVNGGLQNLALPLARPGDSAVDCFIAPVDVMVNGETVTLCAIQQASEPPETQDLIATLESVMADSTSWLTRTVIERLKTMRLARQPAAAKTSASELELLSDRERQVLGLICEGRGDAQMGEMLGLSENTVRNHIASLYRKIGVNRRTAAIIWARERGIASREALAMRPRRRAAPEQNGKALSG